MNYKKKGSVLFIVICILMIIGTLTLFIYNIYYKNILFAKQKYNAKKEFSEQYSVQNEIRVYITKNLKNITEDKKFVYQNTRSLENYKYEYKINWYQYPDKLFLSYKIIKNNKKIEYEKIVFIDSLFNNDLFVTEEIVFSKKIEAAEKLKIHALKITGEKISGIELNINEYKSEYGKIEIKKIIEFFKKIKTVEIKESFLNNQKFENAIIFKEGDLTLRNCIIDTGVIIVTGNFTIENKSSVIPTDKYNYTASNKIRFFEKSQEKFMNYIDLKKFDIEEATSDNVLIKQRPSIICGENLFININDNFYIDGMIISGKTITLKNYRQTNTLFYSENINY